MEENVLVVMGLIILGLLLLSPQQADTPIDWWEKSKEYLNYLLLKGMELPASSLNHLALSCTVRYVQDRYVVFT